MKYRWHKVNHENGKTVIVDREEFHIICTVHKGALPTEDQQAYATLIEAAPELLAQVRMLNHELWRLGRNSKTAEKLIKRIDTCKAKTPNGVLAPARTGNRNTSVLNHATDSKTQKP